MSKIKVLAYSAGGTPKMLTTPEEIDLACTQGKIDGDTEVTLYFAEGTSRLAKAKDHHELAAYFAQAEDAEVDEGEAGGDKAESATTTETVTAVESNEVVPVQPVPTEAALTSQLARAKEGPRRFEGPRRRSLTPTGVAAPKSGSTPLHAPAEQDLTALDWVLQPLRRYAEFDGRARRKEYWSFTAAVLLVYLLIYALGMGGGALPIILTIGLLVPSLAVQVRRLHDTGLSGWMMLVVFIPYAGSIILMVLSLRDGEEKTNIYGPDPKAL